MNAGTIIAVVLAGQVTAEAADIRGDWINERASVIIRIADCDSGLCGKVVWSSQSARRDAARGGTVELNGTNVMYGFTLVSPDRWRGRLFLPDLKRDVRATISLKSPATLKVKGCNLAGILCRTQTWTRSARLGRLTARTLFASYP